MKDLKKYCFLFVLLLLFVPIAQRFIKFTEIVPLNGMQAFENLPDFHYKEWKTGQYQELVEKFVNDNFGFRNNLLRSINSIDFLLFNSSNTKDVLIGKDNQLFFDYNLDSYLGITRQSEKSVDSLMVLTNTLTKMLKNNGTEFIYVIAPSNAYYYSDKFPPQYDRYEKRKNDYEYYLEKFEENKTHYIDFNKWFLEIKDTASFPLFPKNGTHYTYFSSVWVADSLLKYMESLKGIDIPDITMTNIHEDSLKKYEHDLLNILNLGHDVPLEKSLYYDLKFDTVNKTRPNVLVIGDSFFWPISNNLITINCFNKRSYWFYNDKVYPESFTKETHPSELNLHNIFRDLDYVIIISSATLMHNYDYSGFLGNIIGFLDGKLLVGDPELQYWVDAIYANQAWLDKISTKAKEMGTSLEEQIKAEASWMLKQEQKNN
jgi:hypothetical protein